MWMKSSNLDPKLPLWSDNRSALLVEAAVTRPGISFFRFALGTAARRARASLDEGVGHSVGGRPTSIPIWQLWLHQLFLRACEVPKSTDETYP